jgi:hypothetical protein
MTSSQQKSRRGFAIGGPVKRLNRSLPWEASGDYPRGQLVGMVRRQLWVESGCPELNGPGVRLRRR